MPSWSRLRRRTAAPPDDSGFTLIELIVGISILALIIGAISAALITVFADSGATSRNIADSADAQVVSANLTNDVQSAVDITTSSTASQCGTGTQLLGLEWAQVGGTTATFDTVVSYLAVQAGKAWSLVREECLTGSSTPVNRSTVSSDICEPKGSTHLNGCPTTGQPTPSITPSTKQTSVRAGWTSSQGVTGVSFAITEPGSHYTYTLVSDPLPANPPGGTGAVTAPTTSCGYATPGTGTYAQTLCFVNFAKYKYATAAPGKCQTMKEGITGTPFTLTFCLSVQAGTESNTEAPPPGGSWSSACRGSPAGTGSGVPPPPNPPANPCADPSSADIVAVPLPTYTNPPASEAFLGNNGFYTGVPGDPGLYTYLEGTDVTLYFTKIQVLDQNGNAATNWDLVTGDAESTDTAESITWSTCPATGGAQQTSCRTGAPNLNLIPNNPTSTPPNYYGNACLNTKYQQDWLTYGSLAPGSGTPFGHTTAKQEVLCAAGVSEDKTGTVMLEAPEPSTLTVNMVGQGLQAVFLGFLL